MTDSQSRFEIQGAEVCSEEMYRACSRCGLCLSVCPTYQEHWLETDSPRARLMQVRKAVEGELELTPRLIDNLFRCLDCLACNQICPVGMKPGDLALDARRMINQVRPQPWVQSLALRGILPHPAVLESLVFPLKIYQQFGFQTAAHLTKVIKLLPQRLQIMEQMPPKMTWRSLRRGFPEVIPAKGERKYRVAYFLGCVQNVLFAEASKATIRVLAHNGCEVVIPRNIQCCGMPHLGYGDVEKAREFARQNVEALGSLDVDAVITDCATCGSTLKEYGSHVLAKDEDYVERAKNLSLKIKDISEFLGQISLKDPKRDLKVKVTYHDPCHLRRGQKVWREPRKLIQMTGAEYVELRESDWCCGSAGTQMITHYQDSMQILERKMANVAETEAGIIAAGCPGCQMQLRAGVSHAKLKMSVVHPIQLLDRAYQEEADHDQ